MFAIVYYVWLVLGPDLALTGGAPPVHLPKGGIDWDFIGTFRLTDHGKAVTVRLYAEDPWEIASKKAARGEDGIFAYPSTFILHAYFRRGVEAWAHREVFAQGRVEFGRVTKVAPEGVTLELVPAFRFTLEQAIEAEKAGRKINHAFAKVMSATGGVPVVK